MSGVWNDEYRSRCLQSVCITVCGHLLACLGVRSLLQLLLGASPPVGSWWWQLFGLAALTAALCLLHAGCVRVRAAAEVGWRRALLQCCHLRPVAGGLCLTAINALMTLCYLSVVADVSLASPLHRCNDDSTVCLNERHLFMLCLSLANSGYMAAIYFVRSGDALQFAAVQQSAGDRLRAAVWHCGDQAARRVLCVLRCYYPLYWLVGGWLCGRTAELLAASRDSPGSDSTRALLSPYTLLHAAALSWLCWLLFGLGRAVFSALLTASVEMPLTEPDQQLDVGALTLPRCLELTEQPLLQHLAFQQLARLVRLEPARRAPAFQLSQPGGHPRTWNRLAAACLQQVGQLTAALQLAAKPATSSISNNNTSLAAEPTTRDFTGMRSMLYNTSGRANTSASVKSSTSAAPLSPPQQLLYQLRRLLECSYSWWTVEDVRAATAVADGGWLTLWSVEALSSLSAAAITEDRFGAAQQHLAQLLDSLLALGAVLEQLQLPRGRAVVGGEPVCRLQASLRQAVHTALFRLCAVYGPHLNALELQPHSLSRLRQYAEYTALG